MNKDKVLRTCCYVADATTGDAATQKTQHEEMRPCDEPAKWEVYGRGESYTEACDGHLVELLDDSPEFVLFPIREASEEE